MYIRNCLRYRSKGDCDVVCEKIFIISRLVEHWFVEYRHVWADKTCTYWYDFQIYLFCYFCFIV